MQTCNPEKKYAYYLFQLLAHEIGHNLGMKHDFDSSHPASCVKDNHIMSYGNSKEKWSTCSKKDLLVHYNSIKRWCMEG